jgi:hypothetical protein
MLHPSRSGDAGGVSGLRRPREGALTLRAAGLLQAGESSSAGWSVGSAPGMEGRSRGRAEDDALLRS